MTAHESGSIDVIDESSTGWIDHDRVRGLVTFILERMRLDPECTVSVAFVDEEQMTQLHEQWMNEPGPTDVLSFPMDDLTPGPESGPRPRGILGDIVVCPSFAENQARNAGHAREIEVDVLIAHGMLHLLGFDHAEPEEHREMFGLQEILLDEWRPDAGETS